MVSEGVDVGQIHQSQSADRDSLRRELLKSYGGNNNLQARGPL